MKSIYKKGAALAAAALMTVAFAGCGGGDKSCLLYTSDAADE